MKRFIGIDIIKICAIFFVISVHFFLNTNYYSQPLTLNLNLFLQTSLRWFFLISVPLFIMVTGYLQVNKKISKHYYKGLIPLLGIYLFYSVITLLIRHYHYNEKQTFIKWLFDVISFKAIPYGWYVNMYIGLFLLIPFLNLIFNNLKTKKEHLFLLAVLVLICGVPSFFNYMPLMIAGNAFLYFPDWWIGIYPLVYYFLGCYIRAYQPKLKKFIALCFLILIVLIEAALTFYFSKGAPFVYALGEYGSILTMASSTVFFLMVYNLKNENKTLGIILNNISSLTFDIYLVSFIVDKFIYEYVMSKIFESNFQIILFFTPIVGTLIITTLIIGLLRKMTTYITLNLLRRFRKRQTVA